MGRKSAVEVLMQRDGLTREEAEAMVQEVYEHFMECIEEGNFVAAEDAMYEIGLEPDYLEDFL